MIYEYYVSKEFAITNISIMLHDNLSVLLKFCYIFAVRYCKYFIKSFEIFLNNILQI